MLKHELEALIKQLQLDLEKAKEKKLILSIGDMTFYCDYVDEIIAFCDGIKKQHQ